MPVSKFSISLYPNVIEEIDRRSVSYDADANRSGVINKSLDRYFAVLDQSVRRLREILSDGEMGLILDVLNGVMFADTISIHLVYAEVADGIEMDQLDTKWKVDGPALVTKMKALTYAENMALVDAVERWWNRVGAGEHKLPTTVKTVFGKT